MISENNVIHRLTHWAFSAGMIWVLVMMALTAVDVTGRYLFSAPVKGSLELSEFMLAVFGMLGMAYTQQMGANVKVRILEKFLPRRAVLALDSLTFALSLGVILLLVYQSWVMGIEEYHYRTASDSLGVPLYPFHFLLSLSCLVLAIELLVALINSLHGVFAKNSLS
ncbi:MAG: TRAP transporter small permease [Desulfobacterales bacterium]|nr:TRAP transporter small permease [Desulfobacterales bacterium]